MKQASVNDNLLCKLSVMEFVIEQINILLADLEPETPNFNDMTWNMISRLAKQLKTLAIDINELTGGEK